MNGQRKSRFLMWLIVAVIFSVGCAIVTVVRDYKAEAAEGIQGASAEVEYDQVISEGPSTITFSSADADDEDHTLSYSADTDQLICDGHPCKDVEEIKNLLRPMFDEPETGGYGHRASDIKS